MIRLSIKRKTSPMVENPSYRPEQKAPLMNRAERIDTLSEQIEELREKMARLSTKNKGSNTHPEQIGRLEETLRVTTQEFDSLCAAEEADLDTPSPPPKRSSQESNPDQRTFAEKLGQYPHFTVKDMEEDSKGRTFDSGKDYEDKEA